jgi:N-methylhydantoinase B
MNRSGNQVYDPIAAELLRTRLEAISQEAGTAVEQTAISPVVTESKDYSVTITDANGSIISAYGVVELHFGAVMHSIRSTIAQQGNRVADGDVFIANDPHSGGGLHPQDVVIQRPIFYQGQRVAWVALAAHMMDMGGMVPGSSAAEATECFQEALRLPPVRLVRKHEECEDVWNIIRTNIRSADLIEMDIRALVIGGAVAERKILEMIAEIGVPAFEGAGQTLIEGSGRVLRERIRDLEDGHYFSTAWVEYGDTILRFPCDMLVSGDRLLFDLRDSPPQMPHFFNSKPYIIRSSLAPRIRQMLAPTLPFNQSIYDVVEIASKPGTLVDSVVPAPIAAAHMDAAMAVYAAALQCLQLAIYASPEAAGREYLLSPTLAAYGTGRWNYLDQEGKRRVYTLIDGAFSGSPAAYDRDGLDLIPSLTGGAMRMEYADVEILETAYPLLFRERASSTGFHGYGQFRSGLGCREAFGPHGTDKLIGNMTGTREWFPTSGSAGGLPGALMRYAVTRADGRRERIRIQQVGVTLAPGDLFEMECASGGGFGDPLDRDPAAVLHDVTEGRLDLQLACDIYGVVFGPDGGLDLEATEAHRQSTRRDRLSRARPAAARPNIALVDSAGGVDDLPLYPGIVQRGDFAIAERSGAVLAVAPGNWVDGCPVIETLIDPRAGGIVSRFHLDPLTGRILYVDVSRTSDGPSISICPERWMRAGQVEAA